MRKKIVCTFILLSIGTLAFAQATITAPNGSERWALGSAHAITWTHSGVNFKVKLQLFRGETRVGIIRMGLNLTDDRCSWEAGRLDDGSQAPVADGYIVRILRQSDNTLLDQSNAGFSLTSATQPQPASLTLIAPNGNESWTIGGPSQSIRWRSTGLSGTVRLILFRNGTAEANRIGTIADGLPVTPGSYSWPVASYQGGTAVAGSGYYVRVRAEGSETTDVSNGPFTLVAQGPNPQPTSLPDLQGTDIFVDSRSNLMLKVKNNGPAPYTGSVLFRCWENEGPVPFEATGNLSLPAGQVQDVNLAHQVVEPSAGCGIHYSVFVDANRQVTEGNEDNNSLAKMFFLKQFDLRLLPYFRIGRRGHERIVSGQNLTALITPDIVLQWPVKRMIPRDKSMQAKSLNLLSDEPRWDMVKIMIAYNVRNCGYASQYPPFSVALSQHHQAALPNPFDVDHFVTTVELESGKIYESKLNCDLIISNPSSLVIDIGQPLSISVQFQGFDRNAYPNGIDYEAGK